MFPNDCDNNRQQYWKYNIAAKTGSTYISGTTTDSVEIPMANPEFSTMTSSRKCQGMGIFFIRYLQIYIYGLHIFTEL